VTVQVINTVCMEKKGLDGRIIERQKRLVTIMHVRYVNKYDRPRNTQTEMYAGRVVCCSLVSHVEYAPRALLRLEKRRNRQTPWTVSSELQGF